MKRKVEIGNEAYRLAKKKKLAFAVVPWAGTLTKGVIGFDWYFKDYGFGQLILRVEDGKLVVDTEATGLGFAKSVLDIAFENAEII